MNWPAFHPKSMHETADSVAAQKSASIVYTPGRI